MAEDFNSYSDKQIADYIKTMIFDHAVFTKNWNELVFNDELKTPDEIKNRIFCLWVGSCLDTIQEEESAYLPMLGQAKKREIPGGVDYLIQFGNLVQSIKERIRELTEEQQIVISHYRNMFVHGRISGVRRKKVTVKYLSKANDRIEKKEFSQEEFWEIENKTVGEDIDKFLAPLREKFFQKGSNYYNNLITFSKISIV